MGELFAKLEKRCMTHLEVICNESDDANGFASSQQIDDMKDLLQSVRDMHEIQCMQKKNVV